MDAMQWIKGHKLVVGLFGAATVGYILYSFIHKGSSSGTAAPVVGGSPQYLVPVVQSSGIDTSGLSAQASQQTGSNPLPASTSTTMVTNTPSPATPQYLAANGPLSGQQLSPITAAAALQDSKNGQPVYQLGSAAIAYDQANGTPTDQSIGGVNPNGGYVLSSSAIAAAAGIPNFQFFSG